MMAEIKQIDDIFDEVSDRNKFSNNIIQLITFVVITFLIIFRCINYKATQDSWIWIISYIGMEIALINLLINKCLILKKKHHKKYRPFVGLTILIIIISIGLFIPIYLSQSNSFSFFVNDLITLFALFFSLSPVIWNSILNIFVKLIKF